MKNSRSVAGTSSSSAAIASSQRTHETPRKGKPYLAAYERLDSTFKFERRSISNSFLPGTERNTSWTSNMMKVIAVTLAVLCLGQCQRPPYAGSSNRLPVVLPQYQTEQQAPGASGLSNDIGTRLGADNANSLSASTSTSTIPPDLPIDAHGDIELINRIKTWPKEKQPFWFINWQQIQAHRGDNADQQIRPQPNTRSFFAG